MYLIDSDKEVERIKMPKRGGELGFLKIYCEN
jgi:hypothetical protein